MREGLAVCGGRHHFSPSSSFNAALSNMASARSRFCRVFSSSSDFSAWPRKPPSRRTWPSICKSWRRSSRVYGTARQPKLPPHVPSKPDDLLFRKPAALHNPVLHSVRILPSVGGNSGGTSRGSSAMSRTRSLAKTTIKFSSPIPRRSGHPTAAPDNLWKVSP